MVRKTSGLAQKALKEGVQAQSLAIRQDPKQLNRLLELIGQLELPRSDRAQPLDPWAQTRILAHLKACTDVLVHYLERGDLRDPGAEAEPAARTLFEWWSQRFESVWQASLALITGSHHLEPVRELALVAVMRLFRSAHAHIHAPVGSPPCWTGSDIRRFRSLITALSHAPRDARPSIKRFQEFLELPDGQLYTIQALLTLVKRGESPTEPPSAWFKSNVLAFLENLHFRELKPDAHPVSLLCHDADGLSTFNYAYDGARKAFSQLWEKFLRLGFDVDLYKRVLLILDEKIMVHLLRPLLLTDFLVNSYHVGGSISILALNGVFTLIHRYNLEYPDFYQKLYALLQPEVLHAKYRARFFYMTDIFLTSTHLPEYLVAAFVKRLARIALTAPAHAILMVLPFIGNLLLRHKSLRKMLHGRDDLDDETKMVDADPYDPEEKDPALCRAIESSLWEIQALHHHALPQVSQVAKTLSKKLPEMEWDLAEYLETTMEDMMDVETRKTIFVNVPLNFERPPGLKFAKNDLTSQIFTH